MYICCIVFVDVLKTGSLAGEERGREGRRGGGGRSGCCHAGAGASRSDTVDAADGATGGGRLRGNVRSVAVTGCPGARVPGWRFIRFSTWN